MKKTILFAMMAAVLGFAACVKEEPAEPETTQTGMVLHATVAQSEDTKATFTDNEGVWHFDYAEGDQITVYNKVGDNTSSDYTFTYNGTEFISTDAEPTSDPARWYAFYPSKEVSFVGQTGKWEDLANMYALVGSTPYGSNVTGKDGLDITMEPKCAILKIINQRGSIDINVKNKSNGYWIKGISASSSSFILSHDEAKQTLLSTTEFGTYYIAVPAGTPLAVYDGDKTIKSTSKGLTAGKYYEITVSYQGALPGLFSVSDTKKVYFSSGNLRYTVASGTWSFFDRQYEHGPSYYEKGHDSEISFFTWGYNPTKSIVPDGQDVYNISRTSGNLTQEEDWGAAIDNIGTWRTLTFDEWKYLFAWDDDEFDYDVTSPRYGRFKFAVCENVRCVVIAPDDWDLVAHPLQKEYSSTSSPMTWEQAEAAGLVCLPAAGDRFIYFIDDVGTIGNYWSSSLNSYIAKYAQLVILKSDSTDPYFDGAIYRNCANSVRLVTDLTFTVTFDMNGKTGTGPEDLKAVKCGSIIPEPSTPKAKGYSFWGWYKDKDCTTLWDFDSDVVTTDVTLYAKWNEWPIGALPGKFSVSADKQVFFSQGNLWYGKTSEGAGSATFNFEANQYDFRVIGSDEYGNVFRDEEHISHFMWGKGADVACAIRYNDPSLYNNDDVFFTNAAKDTPNPYFTANGQKGMWRALSADEWKYLVDHNGYLWTTINGINGLIIFCDGYYGSKTGLTEIPKDCLFLPAAGFRDGYDGYAHISSAGVFGNYWSASLSYANHPFDLYFLSDKIYPSYEIHTTDRAQSVRLVTDVITE